jgi:hypothetical protein
VRYGVSRFSLAGGGGVDEDKSARNCDNEIIMRAACALLILIVAGVVLFRPDDII